MQLSSSHSKSLCLSFWSIGKLLRFLQVNKTNESLASYGINCHSIDNKNQHHQTFSSDSIWLLGYLHLGTNVECLENFELCDQNVKLLTFFVNPDVKVMNQLVLIKQWILVRMVSHNLQSLFLEVHDEIVTTLLPIHDPYENLTLQNVIQVLETNCSMIDEPLYTSLETWTRLATLYQDDQKKKIKTMVAENKTSKRKFYFVFGRVTSVSPISRQETHENSHFFIEIENYSHHNDISTQSIVYVMFTGMKHIHWNQFLRPGQIVFLTNLIKVRSRECNMLLLQTSSQADKLHSELPTTLVLSWNEPSSPLKNIVQTLNDPMITYTKSFALKCIGKLLDYEGQVSRLLWDECIELIGPGKTRVIVCLFHYPYTNEIIRLRQGTSVRLFATHVLLWPSPVGGTLVIGLCPRSQMRILKFSDQTGACINTRFHSKRDQTQTKWSLLGNFHRQSMIVSMWLLEMLELLNQKFFFRNQQNFDTTSTNLSFHQIRRRKAASILAKRLQLTLICDQNLTRMTLGAHFLKCHSLHADKCTTIKVSTQEKHVTSSRVLTIHEVQKFGAKKMKQFRELNTENEQVDDSYQSICIPATDLDWCLLLGCIRGNIDSGDLELFDRTGSLALNLDGGTFDVSETNECGMYFFRNFNLMVEDYNSNQDIQEEDQLPLFYRLSCKADQFEYIPLHDDDVLNSFAKENAAVETQEIIYLVTHVDPLSSSTFRSSGLLPEYRVLHGLVCPVGQMLPPDQFLSSIYSADILINTQNSSWFVQKSRWYRMKVTLVRKTATTSEDCSIEDRVIQVSKEFSKCAMESQSLCFEKLKTFNQNNVKNLMNQKRQFSIYQVEMGTSIVPLTFETKSKISICDLHTICKQRKQDVNNGMSMNFFMPFNVKQTIVYVTKLEFLALNILIESMQQVSNISQVFELFFHPLSIENIKKNETKQLNEKLHKLHLISIIGIIIKKRYSWQFYHRSNREKRFRDGSFHHSNHSKRYLQCIVTLRDLKHLETVNIRIDTSRFHGFDTLDRHQIVEFSRLEGFYARSSLKLSLNWTHVSAVRQVMTLSSQLSDAQIYGVMSTSFLNDLYCGTHIDNLIHRYVVHVVHINYVVLKRKCRKCHQKLIFLKSCGLWKHSDVPVQWNTLQSCTSKWYKVTSREFSNCTYMDTTLRCIIDDGSGQAELFLENDIAWELLTCTFNQRQRFEKILTRDLDELSYFSGNIFHEAIATNRLMEFYQKKLQTFVLNVMSSLQSIVVFAHQFYKTNNNEGTSVLTFGKDIQVTTKTIPLPKLEAKRVDQLHVRNELHQRLCSLRSRAQV
ncbi:hypothetical protein Plhal304r1_c037g0112381 [Plasmopara halstedii]